MIILQKILALLLVIAMSVGLIAFSVFLSQPYPAPKAQATHHTPQEPENATFANEYEEFQDNHAAPSVIVPPPPPPPPPRVVIGYATRMEERFTIRPRVTCYSEYDGPTEAQGKYAAYWNDDMRDVLPVSETVINQNHYTVAMPKGLRRYHEELVRLPNGAHYFRWLIHVPYYNGDSKDGPEGWRYYSVPRDACPHPGRVDVLFTGSKSAVDYKVKRFKEKPTNLPLTFYEVIPLVVYSDGTTEVYTP